MGATVIGRLKKVQKKKNETYCKPHLIIELPLGIRVQVFVFWQMCLLLFSVHCKTDSAFLFGVD